MGKRVAIVGTGQTHCRSTRKDVNGQELINEAVVRALDDAGLTRDDIDAIVIGNMDQLGSGQNSSPTCCRFSRLEQQQ